MKIGKFAKNFNIPISTVRYYIDMGVLIPNKNNSQYIFTLNDLTEMEIILELKGLRFSLDEIRDFLQILRLYDNRDVDMYTHLLNLYNNKKSQLSTELIKIKKILEIINEKIKECKKTKTNQSTNGGIPLSFISYLACPKCGNSFTLEQVTIQGSFINYGNLHCACNYHAKIENGILLINDEKNMTYYQYMLDTYKEVENKLDFMLFLDMKNINNHMSAYMQKAYEWIDKTIATTKPNNKVILIPDTSSHFLYKNVNSPYFENALIIILGSSKELIESNKYHINSISPNLNIIYVANTLQELPIQKHSIDLWIDCYSSFNFSFFYKYPLIEKFNDYLTQDAYIIGTTNYYKIGSKSIKNINNIYPDSSKSYCLLSNFKSILNEYNFKTYKDEIIGSCKNPGEFFDYHVPGEEMFLYAFSAQKQLSPSKQT